MFEPFIWMFKAENFNKRVLQLFLSMLLLIIIALVLYAVSAFLINDFYIKYTLLILAAIFYISSSLVVQGYFWELTSSIISRDVDIIANNIYSGKIKSVFVISLPEFKPAKFIWRGFARCSRVRIRKPVMKRYKTCFYAEADKCKQEY